MLFGGSRATAQFTPLADYGLIGNCRTAALVSKTGSIDWCCFPHFDSGSFFASILDAECGGRFELRPLGAFSSRQEYLEETNILVTTFTTASGIARVIDGFSVTTEVVKKKILWPPNEIFRILDCVQGEVAFEMVFMPRPNYGKDRARIERRGCLGIACVSQSGLLNLLTDLPLTSLIILDRENGPSVRARFLLTSGCEHQFSLTFSKLAPAILAPLGDALKRRFAETIRYWRTWAAACTYRGRYDHHVRRSALALKLLTFSPSGAVLAAPTTSLPERLGGVRNWDYRYCWLRDAAFTIRALVQLGFYSEARAFLGWLLQSTGLTQPHLQVLYSVYGETRLRERDLTWLGGYCDSPPVRIGNDAINQFQLDVYGEVLTAVSLMLPLEDTLDNAERRFVLSMGKAVMELWDKPDDGIWEVRSEAVHHTHSKVMAWVALDKLRGIAEHMRWHAPIEDYLNVMNELRGLIETYGYDSELGSYTRAFGRKELDASLLVLPLFGYCPASNPRMCSTREKIISNLSSHHLIYRYLNVDDGMPGKEGSFGVCNFWLAENLVLSGEFRRALHYFESLIRLENSVGLWSEEIDPETKDFLGNYPQAFTHVGLINAALTIEEIENQRGSLTK